MAVSSPAPTQTQNTWTCPTCRHGSPDPRDEVAHLDAHRQLGRFLREWDAAVVSDRKKERGRRRWAVGGSAALAVIVALVVGVVFWGLGGNRGSSHPVARPAPAGVAPAPVPAPAVPSSPADSLPPPEAPAPTPAADAAQPAPPPAVSPPLSVGLPPAAIPPSAAAPVAAPAEAALSTSAPSPPAPTSGKSTLQSLRAGPAIPPPTYLVKVCLVGTCLTIP